MNEESLYRKFIDYLHQNDIGKYIELPQIATMGDTSSAKSSVLSAISMIQFPSNDKLTTRCPMRLRMERNNEVSSRVYVKWHKNSKYQDLIDFEPI